MTKRIRQFFSALFAKVSESDREFVAVYLSEAEQALFYGMNLPDQQHVLAVARTALRLAESRPKADLRLLARCALLHDVGKCKGDVSTWDKVITVLGHRLAPEWSAAWGRLGRGGKVDNLRHAFHIYRHHPERSAAFVLAAGAEPLLAEIISRHHKPSRPDDPIELVILREADEEH